MAKIEAADDDAELAEELDELLTIEGKAVA